MLILSRKIGESVLIGDDVTVTVLDCDRGRIKLGITGPTTTPVWRAELRADEGETETRDEGAIQ